MNITDAQERAKLLAKSLEEIDASPRERIADFLKRYPMNHGVYVVSDEDDREVIYVGRSTTNKEGLGGRIRDHCNVREPANLISKIPEGIERIRRFWIRHICIDDPLDRRSIEYYLIAVFHPPYNK